MLTGTEQSERPADSQSQTEGHETIIVPTARRPDERSDEKKQRKGAVREAKVGHCTHHCHSYILERLPNQKSAWGQEEHYYGRSFGIEAGKPFLHSESLNLQNRVSRGFSLEI